MKAAAVLLLIWKTALIGALSTNEIFSKDYIDLLKLTDNDEFQWGLRENLQLSSDHFEGQTNNHSKLFHHLVKRQSTNPSNPFLNNKNYGVCNIPSGGQGECRQPLYCDMPELRNNTWLLISHLCVIDQKSVGICCPKNFQSTGPQIIADINDPFIDPVRIATRPEQRGCGITTKQFPRVTGGRPAEPDEWPWMVALLRRGWPAVWCGGVLITDRLVLTAAHCLYNINKTEMSLRLGEYNTKITNETRARDFQVANWLLHIDYNHLSSENDIALIRLDRPTIFNTYIWPICMPPLNEDWHDQMAVITGWGTQRYGGIRSDILMETSIPIWRNEDCKRALVERVADSMLCAGFPEGGQDSCQGDSGGPLLIQLPNRRWVVIGIISWGAGCGLPYQPGVYTRVNQYLHWVVENSDI